MMLLLPSADRNTSCQRSSLDDGGLAQVWMSMRSRRRVLGVMGVGNLVL